MVDREMLLAMSDLLEEKLEEKLRPIYERLDRIEDNVFPRLDRLEGKVEQLQGDMKYVRVVQLENDVLPRLHTIEGYYLDTSKRYIERTRQIDDMESDIAAMKGVIENHSNRLNEITA